MKKKKDLGVRWPKKLLDVKAVSRYFIASNDGRSVLPGSRSHLAINNRVRIF